MHVSVEVQCWLVDFADHVISPGPHAVWPVDSSVYHLLGQLVLSAGHARWVQAYLPYRRRRYAACRGCLCGKIRSDCKEGHGAPPPV
ncbi:hypothetical protein D2E76_26325 [Mycobacteroides abscessus]|uniref:Uncharacterized protein n=1 Tax=Mycobacteroides abscessus TaxID=36809 RepID=A0ABD7HHG5_9MYCO|nr:hypothetical protein D2E76_26325 [Mycobacteroides abscessus]